MFHLVLNPGTPDEERLAFSVTRSDIEDAIDHGRARDVKVYVAIFGDH